MIYNNNQLRFRETVPLNNKNAHFELFSIVLSFSPPVVGTYRGDNAALSATERFKNKRMKVETQHKRAHECVGRDCGKVLRQQLNTLLWIYTQHVKDKKFLDAAMVFYNHILYYNFISPLSTIVCYCITSKIAICYCANFYDLWICMLFL